MRLLIFVMMMILFTFGIVKSTETQRSCAYYTRANKCREAGCYWDHEEYKCKRSRY